MSNFNVWNPADKNAGITLADANLTAYLGSGSGFRAVRGDIPKDHGKWYFEVSITEVTSIYVGVAQVSASLSVMESTVSWYHGPGLAYHDTGGAGTGFTFLDGDVMMIAIDIDAGKLFFGRNGYWYNYGAGGSPVTGSYPVFNEAGLQSTMYPIVGLNDAGQITANFGQSAFLYLPTGYSGWGDIELEAVNRINFSDAMDNLQPDYEKSIGIVDRWVGSINYPGDVDGIATMTMTAEVYKAFGKSTTEIPRISDSFVEETDIIGVQKNPLTIKDTWDLVGYYTCEGSDFVLPALTLSAEGYDSCFGEMDAILPALEIEALGVPDESGSLDLVLPKILLDAEGEDTILGYLDAQLPMITLEALGEENPEGTLDIILPMLRISAEGIDGSVGTMDADIPMITLDALAILSCSGELDATIPMIKLSSTMEPDTYQSLVLNIRNNALTIYNNYLFNSMCRFNGVNLGATSTKIFNLNSGTRDNGAEIDWNFRLPYLNMEIKTKKHLRLAWFSYKSDGDIIVTVVQPDGTEYEYDLKGYEVTEDGVRVKFGRGIKSKYLAVDVKSKDGSTIDLDTIRILLDAFKAR